MAELSSSQRSALLALVHQDSDGRWRRASAVATCHVRTRLGSISYTARETRDLMWRFNQAGLVEGALRTVTDAVTHWRITDTGFAALGLEDGANG